MEGSDSATIGLPGKQEALLQRVAASAKKTIAVIVASAPVSLSATGTLPLVDGLVMTYFNGQSTGQALADVMFGAVAPSAKLPYTIPVSMDWLPPMENYTMVNRTYRFSDPASVLYPYWYGLSYTNFECSDSEVEIAAQSATTCLNANLTFAVTNVGDVAGAEVAQVSEAAGTTSSRCTRPHHPHHATSPPHHPI